MWRNAEMKADAKFHLEGSWAPAIAVPIITSIVNSLAMQVIAFGVWIVSLLGFGMNIMSITSALEEGTSTYKNSNLTPEQALALASTGIIIYVVMILGIVLVNIFVTYPLSVGQNNWFVRNRESRQAPQIQVLFSAFTKSYKKVLAASLWHKLWIFIWSLPLIFGILFSIISGVLLGNQSSRTRQVLETNQGSSILLVIVFVFSVLLYLLGYFFIINRSFAYMLMPYILADNPDIGAKRSMDLSKKMMKGNKLHLFGLQLSFLGWALLALLTCGIGGLFLTPYVAQTIAEVYARLRSIAVERGDTSMEELGFVNIGQSSSQSQMPNNSPNYGNYNQGTYPGTQEYGQRQNAQYPSNPEFQNQYNYPPYQDNQQYPGRSDGQGPRGYNDQSGDNRNQ